MSDWLASLSEEDYDYVLKYLPSHMAEAGDGKKLFRFLTDFDFITAKIAHPQLQSQDLIEDYDRAFEYEDLILAVAISQDGSKALSGSANGILKLWDLIKGIDEWTISNQTELVLAVAISEDGRRGLSGLADGTLKLWKLDSDKECRTLTGHANSINAVALTPDGQWALSGSADCTLKLWDLENGQELYTLTGHHGSVMSVAMTPNRRWAISGSWDRTLKLWDLNSRNVLKTVKLWERTSQSYETPKSWNSKNIIDIYANQEFSSGPEWHFPNSQGDRVISVAMTPDVRWAVSGSDDETLKLWNLASGNKPPPPTSQQYNWVCPFAITPDGQWVVSVSNRGNPTLWNVIGGKEQRTLADHSGWWWSTLPPPNFQVNAIAVTPDGQWALFGSNDGIELWNLCSGNQEWAIDFPGAVKSLVVTSNWVVLYGLHDGSIGKLHLLNGTQQQPLIGHNSSVNALVVTPDGQCAISASDDTTLKVWDLESGKVITSFNGDCALKCCTVAPDGVTIVAGDVSGRVHFLRLEGMY